MARTRWRGDALAVAQVTSWTFGGTWEASDIVKVTINNKTVSVVAGSATIATLLDTVVAALNDSTIPEFTEITWSRNGSALVATGKVPGQPFEVTLISVETNGSAADAQSIGSATTVVACTGPNWASEPLNWDPALPADGDDVDIRNSEVPILYGLDLSAITPATLSIDMSMTGAIGLPRYNAVHGYYEYRERSLKFGNSGDAGHILVDIGKGEGSGADLIALDFGDGRVTCTIHNSRRPTTPGVPTVQLSGAHTSNAYSGQKGSVGIGFEPGDASAIATLNMGYRDNVASDVEVEVGPDVSQLTTINKSGGVLVSRCDFGTLLNLGGTATIESGGCNTELDVRGGSVIWNSTGTLGGHPKVSGDGVLDFSRDMRPKTVTNPINRYGDRSRIRDPFKVVSGLVVDLEFSGSNLESIEIGTHLKLTRGTPT